MAYKKNTGVKNRHAQALGQLGGLKGGPARKMALSKSERSMIARKAAVARWSMHREYPSENEANGAAH